MAHLYSMTGYGKAMIQLPSKKITIEVKSLNSKQIDMNIRTPSLFREKEADIRRMVAESCNRGKIDFNFYCEITGAEMAPRINDTLVKEYIRQLKKIMDETQVQGDVMAAVMRLPDVTQSAEDEVDEEEWEQIKVTIGEALQKLEEFRAEEGNKLREELQLRLNGIRNGMAACSAFDGERMERIKEKLQRALAELQEKPDENRYEQELIYYLEKLDITEEKVRLKSHLDYFEELMNEGGAVGKKLGFIGQEIGREINTMGSKANHAGMQKQVVEMKDELEKIKEQVLNIL